MISLLSEPKSYPKVFSLKREESQLFMAKIITVPSTTVHIELYEK